MVNKILLSTPTNALKYETLVDEFSISPFIFRFNEVQQYDMTWVHKDIEFNYIIDSEAAITLNGRNVFAKAGQTVCVNSYTTHKILSPNVTNTFMLMISTNFCIENGIDTSKLQFEDVISDPKIGELFGELAEEYKNENTNFRESAIRAAVLRLLVYISRNYSKESNANKSDTIRSFGNAFEYTTKAIDFINKNFKHKLSLDEIAASSGASKYHFLRTFKRVTGYTVTDYINQIRCKFAKEMLISGDHSVKETAMLSGFENLSHFTNTFKKYEGALPSEFLKRKKEIAKKEDKNNVIRTGAPCTKPPVTKEEEEKDGFLAHCLKQTPGKPARNPCYMPLNEDSGGLVINRSADDKDDIYPDNSR